MKRECQIVWHNMVESTNDEVRKGFGRLPNLSVTAARYQTKGRGQGDHLWHSPECKNLTFSILLDFNSDGMTPLLAKDELLLTCITTLGIREFLLSFGIESKIKWPNDIYVENKKICGILIENVLAGQYVDKSIVGIGLNVNERTFPGNLPNPVSMAILTGLEYNLNSLLEKLVSFIELQLEKADTPQGREYLLNEFSANMFRLSEDPR